MHSLSLRAALLACAAALLLAAAPVRASYRRAQHTAVTEDYFLMDAGTKCAHALKRACDALPECAGFLSNGVLLSSIPARRSADRMATKADAPDDVDLFVRVATVGTANLWPTPQHYTNGGNKVSVAYPFTFSAAKMFPDLQKAFDRFSALVFPHRAIGQAGSPLLSELQVTVDDPDAPLKLKVDESYTLTIPDDGSAATLHAPTFWGALRGLESFGQLVTFNFDAHGYMVGQAPWSITDAPRFPHRGVMIDTARHFEPVATIKTVIDSLTYAKFNTLHWHVVDSQSFPFESRSYPLLWTGAYSEQERYTHEDMQDVVEYARQRGVRVVVEFDIPGHAESWCTGYPDVCPAPTCLTPLDPSTPAIYDLMGGLWGEVTGNASGAGIFPDDYIHLGGDEVITTCWTSTPRIAKWLQDNNLTPDQGYMYIVEKAHDIVSAMGRHPINWEEVFNHFGTSLDPATIIQIWLDHATLAKVVAAGYQGILSNSDVWYLDHLDVTWQQFYGNEPFEGITNTTQQALVLGGEVCMWGETVDSSDIFSTIWPRAAAAAERLWSPADLVDTNAALVRLERFRCLLNTRGIDAAPVLNAEARSPPPNPGGCYVQ